MLLQALCIILYPLVNSNWSYSPETPNLGQIRRFFEPCDLEILQMTLKNNRAHLQCYFKLCASFRTHWWIQTGVTVRKRPIRVKKRRFFFSRVTFKLNIWPWKTIGHLFYVVSGFVHQSFHSHQWILTGVTVRKHLIWVKIGVFFSRVTLKFDRWPWKQ